MSAREGAVQIADVYKSGVLAAQLRRYRDRTEFEYLPSYLDGGAAVATTLPLIREVTVLPPGAVPAFFAGLLPEGRRLTALRQLVKTSADDEFSLIEAVGRDPVGDVQVVAEGDAPVTLEPLFSVSHSFGEVRFSDIMGRAGIVDRVGIAGVQEKASAGMISLPVSQAGHQYLLKIDPPEYPFAVDNEAYFLELSRRCAIATVHAEVVVDAQGRHGLLVRRFDRVIDPDGTPRRRAVEDACQLLNLWPADKYNTTAEEVLRAIARVCPAAPVALRDAFRQLVFAWLTGDGDVHAKNLSVVSEPGGEWRLAPAYDLPSTMVYGDLTMALPIGGRRDGLTRAHWMEFAREVGLAARAAQRVLDELLEATASLGDDLLAGVLPFDQNTTSDWVKRLRYRHRQLRR